MTRNKNKTVDTTKVLESYLLGVMHQAHKKTDPCERTVVNLDVAEEQFVKGGLKLQKIVDWSNDQEG